MPRLLAILALLPLAFAASARADVTVQNTNDDGPGSLRQLLRDSADPVVLVPPGNYRLASQLLIERDVTVRRIGDGVALIESTGNFRVLCMTGPNDVTLDGLTIHGGRASPGATDCPSGDGGGISSAANSLTVLNSVIQHNTAAPDVGGGGGGIFASGDLTVEDSIVRHNTATALSPLGTGGGGGIYWAGSGFPSFEVIDSTVYENTATVAGDQSGGAGIWSEDGPSIENVTFSGNQHRVSPGAASTGGGGAVFALAGGGSIVHATFFGNHSDRPGGALAGASNTVQNSLFHVNTAPTDPDCAPGATTSDGGNVTSTPFAACGFGAQDQLGAELELGPLAANGSDNGTLTHEILARDSVPVEFPLDHGGSCPLSQDQRGASRTQFGDCDSGAYEFDGRAVAAIPDCSPTGMIPLTLDAPPGHRVVGVSYRVGPSPTVLQAGATDTGAPLTPASVSLDEGRTTLEYWGRWESNAGGSFPEEQGHGLQGVLVDKTRPAVDVANTQGRSIFVITRRARVNVAAADVLSGLVQNPSATGIPISTARRGAASFSSTAADLCQNQGSDSFDYRVLAPGLGVRTVLERVSGRVRVRRVGGGAQASQTGRGFAALTQPRELPVRSFIDARRGTTRLTTARTRREDQIQDGLFTAGVFQVLQSRRRRARGLTEVRLKGGNFGRRCRPSASGGPGAAQVRRRVVRRLRGNARGRFRTRGRHSAATVRGTMWQVIDRCDGTLTKVTRGRVAVRDFRRRRTVIVRAGQSYLARAPR